MNRGESDASRKRHCEVDPVITNREKAFFLLGAGHVRDVISERGEAAFIGWFAGWATAWGISTEFLKPVIEEIKNLQEETADDKLRA
jgi:hypothetical protein